jgi:predicted ATPase
LRPGTIPDLISIGRKAELKEWTTCLRSAIGKKVIVVFINGEAGTVKTRLLREFLKTLRKGS